MQQRRDLAATLLSQPPENPPGTKYSYANNGFMLAGAMVEQIAGLSWENVARERLFKPLGITTGGFGAPQASPGHAAPRGHRADGTTVSANADNPAYYGPAGTAHMTIGDWAKFIALHLRGDPTNPNAHAKLLKPATFAVLHAAAPGETYAFGWGISTRPWAKGARPGDIGRTLSHSGSNTYWYCTTWLAPEIDFAVLVTCNQGGDEANRGCDAAIGAMIGKFVRR
jgi:D-alanyl-D-alanine carboxypeptidase